MGYSHGLMPWPITPDWGNGVGETLSFGSEVLHASATAESHHRAWRIGPLRSFDFTLLAADSERRIADMLLAGRGHHWLLPIWPDVQWLKAAVQTGSTSIACNTDGFDFVEGGKALLFKSARQWEVVEVAAIEPDAIGLASATASEFGKGSRLFPLRRARAAWRRGAIQERGGKLSEYGVRHRRAMRLAGAFQPDDLPHAPRA